MPAPTIETLAMSPSWLTPPAPICAATSATTFSATPMSALGTVKEMSVRPVLRGVLHDHVDVDVRGRQRFEERRRDAGPVGHGGHRHLGLGHVVHDAGDDGVFHARLLVGDPRSRLPGEAGADVERRRGGCGRTRRSAVARTRPPAAGDLEHLVEVDLGQLAGLRDDPGVGREHAGDVGVDLAAGGPERAAASATAVRSDAPRPSVVISFSVDTPWKPATTQTLPWASASRTRSPLTSRILALPWTLSVMMPDLAAGERDGVDPEVGEGHADERHGLALADGEQHVHLPPGLGPAETASASAMRLSVSLPMADTTTTRSWPWRRVNADVLGHGPDAIGVGDRCAAVLLDDQGHGSAG